MPSLVRSLMSDFSSYFKILEKLVPILKEMVKNDGKPYLVGGTVRDFVLEQKIKDIDIEVHAMTIENLEKCLQKFGQVKLVGKKFGVLRLENIDVDWSLPRKDTKGRKPKVAIDPFMTIK
ncbi:MAG: hypothetical protein IIB66_03680, partial [Proteobacteria bacterium]|nr:hypothetical protein [Pseudomonadota bacterium]